MTRRIIIYHDDCPDGMMAAYLALQGMTADDGPDAKPVVLHPAKYGSAPPDVKGARVVMVDFSYKRPVLEQMLADCEDVLIIDHHQTAEAELADLRHPKLTTVFDMTRSGAGLVWDIYRPTEHRHPLVDRIEDYDLWRFKLLDTPAICAAFRAIRVTNGMAACRMALEIMETNSGYDIMVAAGTHILELRAVIIGNYLKGAKTVRFEREGHYICLAAECLPEYASDVGHELLQMDATMDFSATYRWDPEDGLFRVSLRSLQGGFDVSELARKFGGGGHQAAAGFQCPVLPWAESPVAAEQAN